MPGNCPSIRRSGCRGTIGRSCSASIPDRMSFLAGRKGSSSAMRTGHAEMAVKRTSEKTKSGQVFGQSRNAAKMFRVGLYARVSTQDQQTLPLQMRAMREYTATRGWSIGMQVKEV